jgi:hypothetical protein
MAMWVRAVCPSSVGHVRLADLREVVTRADFAMLAEAADLSDEAGDAVEAFVHLEAEPGPFTVVHLYARPDAADRHVRVERWTGAQAREEADELLGELDADVPPRIRQVLGAAVDIVAFELHEGDDGIVWGLVDQLARWLAVEGAGLVEAEGEWREAATGEVLRELR